MLSCSIHVVYVYGGVYLQDLPLLYDTAHGTVATDLCWTGHITLILILDGV